MIAVEGILFYLFGAVMLTAGVGVVTMRNPVYCALLLVVAFMAGAVLWLLLGAEFLAWVLILVYVGAVMVLFLFVVMMLDINFDRLREGFWRYMPLGLLVAFGLAVQIYLVVNSGLFGIEEFPQPQSAVVDKDYSHVKELGAVLYTDYLLAFEIAAIILLVAIVAAIVLTMRRRKDTKYLDPSTQVEVKASDRVSLVSIELEQPVVAPEPSDTVAEAEATVVPSAVPPPPASSAVAPKVGEKPAAVAPTKETAPASTTTETTAPPPANQVEAKTDAPVATVAEKSPPQGKQKKKKKKKKK